MVKLWQRHFALETVKMLLLVLGCFYLLYAVIDYSLHTKALNATSVSFSEISSYYFYQFSKRAAILVPFSLLIACVKVLSTLNLHNECVALLAGGLPLKRMINPLLAVALGCVLLLYANYQWAYPVAFEKTVQFEERFIKQVKHRDDGIHVVRLKDGSNLVYGSYDTASRSFIDAFWLRTPGDIYHMRRLHPDGPQPWAESVDHLVRRQGGQLERSETFDRHVLSNMQFDEEDLFSALVPAEQLSLSDLWRRLPSSERPLNDREIQVTSQLNAKLAFPLSCLLIVIAPASWCLRFSRHLRIFFIYCGAITAFLLFFTSMDAAMILSENHVLPPLVILWAPLTISSMIFGWRYARL